MAYLVRRAGNRIEIRESVATPRGPRSRVLARFRGNLTPGLLARAAERASRPFDAEALARRASVLGIAVRSDEPESEARSLLLRLRRGSPIDPVMASLLMRALERATRSPIPERLADVADWVGASLADRGAAIRDLLDAYGRVDASRPRPRTRPAKRFPRFESRKPVPAA